MERIIRKVEIVWFHQCQGGCRNCSFCSLYLMLLPGYSECTKDSGCFWSTLDSCCPKNIKWGRRKEEGYTVQAPFFQRILCLNLVRVFFYLIHITCCFYVVDTKSLEAEVTHTIQTTQQSSVFIVSTLKDQGYRIFISLHRPSTAQLASALFWKPSINNSTGAR